MHYWIVSRPQAAGRQSRTYPGEGERLRVEPPPDALCRVPCDNSSDRVYDGSLHPPTPVAGCYEQSESSRCAWVTCLISQPASLPAQVQMLHTTGETSTAAAVASIHTSYTRGICPTAEQYNSPRTPGASCRSSELQYIRCQYRFRGDWPVFCPTMKDPPEGINASMLGTYPYRKSAHPHPWDGE